MKLPRYPIYIPSRGRADNAYTINLFLNNGVPFSAVVEKEEAEAYGKIAGGNKVLTLPESGKGLTYARNWIKNHATAAMHARHWQFDDDIRAVMRLYRGHRIYSAPGPVMAAAEDFADRYENVALASFNSEFFVPLTGKFASDWAPFYLNARCYTIFLINNAISNCFRGRYNEDTDMSLQVLADGWCTILFNAFLIVTPTTMTHGGGQTGIYVDDGRLRMARELERRWPRVVTVKRKFRRPQHHIKSLWKKFDTPLKPKPGVKITPGNDEYGMKLVAVKKVESKRLQKLLLQTDSVHGIVSWSRDKVLQEFVQRCGKIGADSKRILEFFQAFESYYKGTGQSRPQLRKAMLLEEQWYESLKRGEPDYSVYGEEIYLADVLACWFVYSRKYIGLLQKFATKEISKSKLIVDVGCGIGLTTAALSEMTTGKVVGTQFPNSWQDKFAKTLAADYGFELKAGVSEIKNGKADFIFASEYFEHFEQPVDHLREILQLEPSMLLVANAFGAHSLGHFDAYVVADTKVTPKAAGKAFNDEMRCNGYEMIKTGWWNNRPSLWKSKSA